MDGGWPGRQESFLSFYFFFPVSLVFFCELCKFHEFGQIHKIREHWETCELPQSLLENWLCICLLDGEKNCIVYSLFYIFIIVIISSNSSSSISISFFVLLNCLYLNPQVLPLAHFSSLSHWGERGGVSEWLSSA